MGKEKDSGTDLHNQRNDEAWRKLARVMGAFMARVGTEGLSADDAAIRLQAAMDGNLVVATPPLPPRPKASAEPARPAKPSRSRQEIVDRASRFVQRGQHDRAIQEYLKIVMDDPQDVRTWLKIGDLYAKAGSRSEAVQTYQKVAEIYATQGFYLKAVAVYRQILKLDPTLIAINLKLAELYRMLGLFADAFGQYEIIWTGYRDGGKMLDAAGILERMIKLDPENAGTHLKLGELRLHIGNVKGAAESFERACVLLKAQNREDDFVSAAERLVYCRPDDLATLKELAKVYLERRDGKRALQKLQELFRAEPKDTQVLEMLAEAFLMLGQIGKVRQVRDELQKIYQSENRTVEAQRIAVLLENMPETLDSVLEEVRVLEKHECKDQAVKILTRFIAFLRRENRFGDYLVAADRLVELTNNLKLAHELLRLREKGSFEA